MKFNACASHGCARIALILEKDKRPEQDSLHPKHVKK